MATEKIQVEIETTYDDTDAAKALRDAEQIEGADPTLVVDADVDQATGGIEDVQTSAQDLMDRNPWIAEVHADIDSAKGDLDTIKNKLGDTGAAADDAAGHIDKIGRQGGPQVGVQALSDMLGPLGDVSGAASEAGQSIEGIGAFAEAAAAKVGIESAAMSAAIGGIGIAVGIAAAVWTVYKKKQEDAKKKAEEHLKIQEDLIKAVQDGNREVASQKFLELYGNIIDKGHEAGLSTKEVVDSIRGVGDAAPTAAAKIEDLDRKIGDLKKTRDDLIDSAGTKPFALQDAQNASGEILKLEGQRDALKNASTEFANLTDKQKANAALQSDVQNALLGTTGSLDDTAAAADRAKQKADDLAQGFSDLRGELDFSREADDLQTSLIEAMNNVALGIPPTKEEIRSIEDQIISVGEMAGKNPIEVKSEVQKVENGQMAEVLVTAQSWMNQHAIEVQVKVATDSLQTVKDSLRKFGINLTGSGGATAGGTSVSTVNVNLPRGARHSDIARAINQSTRRSGRRYGNVVQYARR